MSNRSSEHAALYTSTVPDAEKLSAPPSAAGVWCRRLLMLLVIAASFSVGITMIIGGRHRGADDTQTAQSPIRPLGVFLAPGCSNDVFCRGPLLAAVQSAQLFSDDKSFVDMPIKRGFSPSLVLSAFGNLSTGDSATLRQLVNKYFDDANSILYPVTAPDYTDAPRFLDGVMDAQLKTFGRRVHSLWRNLTMRYADLSAYCDDCYTAIPLNRTFVVPGGRFREFYYWDSLWILQGLLISGLNSTATDLVSNFVDLVERFGFVPNGARTYYTGRSQPPVLALVISTFVNSTGGPANNIDLLKRAVPAMQREHDFWWTTVNTIEVPIPGQTKSSIRMYRYNTNATLPRPESYVDDVRWAAISANSTTFYRNVAAGAETGWDFSTRWFEPGSTSLADIISERVVPVDLNCLLLQSAELIASLASSVGLSDVAATYNALADNHRSNIIAVFRWSNWSDVVVSENGTQASARQGYYASIAVAASTPSIAAQLTDLERTHIVDTLKSHLLIGGLKTSDINSGQQWDGFNAFPPLQYFGRQALNALGNRALGDAVASSYINTTYCGMKETGYMIEKYNATTLGLGGNGGEYPRQFGFGWSNGLLLSLLNEYGSSAKAPNC